MLMTAKAGQPFLKDEKGGGGPTMCSRSNALIVRKKWPIGASNSIIVLFLILSNWFYAVTKSKKCICFAFLFLNKVQGYFENLYKRLIFVGCMVTVEQDRPSLNSVEKSFVIFFFEVTFVFLPNFTEVM